MKTDSLFLKDSFLKNYYEMNFKEDPFLLTFFRVNDQLKDYSMSTPSKEFLKKIRAWYLFLFFFLIYFNSL